MRLKKSTDTPSGRKAKRAVPHRREARSSQERYADVSEWYTAEDDNGADLSNYELDLEEEPQNKQGPLRRLINHWWDRLLDVADKRSFSQGASEYAANQTTRDYLLNTVGLGAWGALFPILSIVATQLAGAEQAGMFSMAFTTATLMLYIGNYGVRTYQVSDIEETDSFASYQVQRIMTCILMFIVGWLWCTLKGYNTEMTIITWGAFGFRAVDALADVYEARLQQMDKLYLSGVSQAVRSILGIAVFTILLFVSRSVPVACIGMTVAAVVSFVLVTLPLALLETPKSRGVDIVEIKELFVECFPSFAAQFLFALIETMPKFAMEGVLPYEDQVYFNAIYFPAQTILMIVGFVYKPQLVRIANVWADPSKRARFDLIVVAMLAVSVGVTAGMFVVFGAVGIWLNGLMYGIDFEPFRTAQYLMIVAGGLSAAIDFLYQIITVLRRQSQATVTYLIAFGVVALASIVLVRVMGFNGAVWSYLIVMVVLFGMLAVQYLLIRFKRS
ncbi:MAG: lipopolysaccharide biosynthesis protein [Coriobacteriales bacterium]|nr:lipopolysaccharide biosynthesis protein [Coriobacteriales bacterium]